MLKDIYGVLIELEGIQVVQKTRVPFENIIVGTPAIELYYLGRGKPYLFKFATDEDATEFFNQLKKEIRSDYERKQSIPPHNRSRAVP